MKSGETFEPLVFKHLDTQVGIEQLPVPINFLPMHSGTGTRSWAHAPSYCQTDYNDPESCTGLLWEWGKDILQKNEVF